MAERVLSETPAKLLHNFLNQPLIIIHQSVVSPVISFLVASFMHCSSPRSLGLFDGDAKSLEQGRRVRIAQVMHTMNAILNKWGSKFAADAPCGLGWQL